MREFEVEKGEESQWMQSENEDIIIAIGITIYYPQWYYLSKWRPGTQSLLDEAAFASLKQLFGGMLLWEKNL